MSGLQVTTGANGDGASKPSPSSSSTGAAAAASASPRTPTSGSEESTTPKGTPGASGDGQANGSPTDAGTDDEAGNLFIHSFITGIYIVPLSGATQRRYQPQHDQIEPP